MVEPELGGNLLEVGIVGSSLEVEVGMECHQVGERSLPSELAGCSGEVCRPPEQGEAVEAAACDQDAFDDCNIEEGQRNH